MRIFRSPTVLSFVRDFVLKFCLFRPRMSGGSRGFSKVVWGVSSYDTESHVTFTYHSFDGEEGKIPLSIYSSRFVSSLTTIT